MTTEPLTPAPTASPAVDVWWLTATRTTARKAPTRPTMVIATCTAYRLVLGTNASTRTPMRANPKTTSSGSSAE
jgi:hypothetical protein